MPGLNEIPNINVDFTYDLPDKYLYKTSELGLTADFTYTGPAKFYCFVNADTGKVLPQNDTEAYDGTTEQRDKLVARAGQAERSILVDARAEPLLAALLWMEIDQADFPQTEFTRTDVDPSDTTVYYSRATIPTPDHTYEVGDIQYDFIANEWVKPFPWKNPHMDWDTFNDAKNRLIEECATAITEYTDLGNTDLATAMGVMKADLEAISTKFPTAQWDPWMVPFPQDPRAQTVQESDDPPPGQIQVQQPIMPAEILASAMDDAVQLDGDEPLDVSNSPMDTSTNT